MQRFFSFKMSARNELKSPKYVATLQLRASQALEKLRELPRFHLALSLGHFPSPGGREAFPSHPGPWQL